LRTERAAFLESYCGEVIPAGALRLAILAPLGTTTTGDGHQMLLGAHLAAEELTAAARPIELVHADTVDARDEPALEAVDRLIRLSDVDAVVTGYASRTNVEIESLADARVPYVVAENSIKTQLRIAPTPERYPTVWGLMPSYDAYGADPPVFLESALEALSIGPSRRVFIIRSANEYSRRCATLMAQSFELSGWSIAGQAEVPFESVDDWTGPLDEARAAEPSVVVSTDYLPHNAAALARQFRAEPFPALLHQQYAPKYAEYAAYAGTAAAGVIFNVLGGPIEELETTRRLRALFRDRFHLEPSRYAFDVYQAVHLVVRAADLVGSNADRERLGRAIGSIEMDVVEGRLRFDPATHLGRHGDGAIPMRWYQHQPGGSVVCLSPATLRTGRLVRPAWLS
jgi:branched-chain amino acid transport system substrate-binding protein